MFSFALSVPCLGWLGKFSKQQISKDVKSSPLKILRGAETQKLVPYVLIYSTPGSAEQGKKIGDGN